MVQPRITPSELLWLDKGGLSDLKQVLIGVTFYYTLLHVNVARGSYVSVSTCLKETEI